MKRASLVVAVLAFSFGLAAANPAGDNVVINEIYCDPPSFYDGSEFIELYNPTVDPIDISGWVLTGPEYFQICGGENRWEFPEGTIIAADGYIVVAKDALDGDGFYDEFPFEFCDFEMYDPPMSYEVDHLPTPNMIRLDDDPANDDQVRLVGGNGYGVICGFTSHADVVYLYTSASLITLVDLVEYADMTECVADPCPGDDGADDNAYPDIPFVGNTLGRSPTSADTDNSSVDFSLQAPTPGYQNTLNQPPWIRLVRYSPIPPNDSTPTDVSAMITDEGAVVSVDVWYSVNGGAWNSVVATAAPGDSVYHGLIPTQSDGYQIDYYVEATDDQGATISYPGTGQADPFSFSIGYTPIAYIQENDISLTGQAANVRGIVTAGEGVYLSSVIYIHEGVGPYKGIKCYVSGFDGDLNEGDDVTVCGTISEYYDETEISRHFPESIVVHSSGNPVYGYTDIATADIAWGSSSAELYEGQLCSIDNVTVDSPDIGYGMWTVYDTTPADTCRVDDLAYYNYTPQAGDELAELRGTVQFSYGTFKINPRYDEDIIGPPEISTVRYSPIPPVDGEVITISAEITDNVAVTSADLHYKSTAMGSYATVPMVQGVGDSWAADIGPFTDGQRVYYYITASDGTLSARRPVVGTYSFYVGLLTIAEVQATDGGGDASAMDTLAVNVRGNVTAEPGIFSNYNFYIQDQEGAWNGVQVFDRTATLSFVRGDDIIVCGEVEEYFGETQIALHFPEAAVYLRPGGPPYATPIATPELQNVITGEKYEGVLVYAADATVEVADLGFGEWAIQNTGSASDTCRVDDRADYDYVPTEGDNVYVHGITTFSFGNYKMEPRGNEDIVVNPTGVDDGVVEQRFALAQNVPNPFNPKTTIAFSLAEAGGVTLEVYDVTGRRIASLVSGWLGAGPHHVVWDGTTDTGEKAASGVYFYKLATGEDRVSRKMVLLK
jgi:hypothetical protein